MPQLILYVVFQAPMKAFHQLITILNGNSLDKTFKGFEFVAKYTSRVRFAENRMEQNYESVGFVLYLVKIVIEVVDCIFDGIYAFSDITSRETFRSVNFHDKLWSIIVLLLSISLLQNRRSSFLLDWGYH